MNNKSKTYIYPLFHKELRLLLFNNLHNTYLYNDQGENLFTLVYRFEEEANKKIVGEFFKLNKLIENSGLISDILESSIKNKIAYVLNIPKEIETSFNFFKEGLYSRFPEKDKYIITKFNQTYYSAFPKEVYNITSILFNNPEYREELSKEFGYRIPDSVELSSKPNEELETFSLEVLNFEPLII